MITNYMIINNVRQVSVGLLATKVEWWN